MGPGASKLKHLPVKTTRQGHGRPKGTGVPKDAVLGVQMAQPQAKRKDTDRQTIQGRAFCFGWLKPLPKHSVLPTLCGWSFATTSAAV